MFSFSWLFQKSPSLVSRQLSLDEARKRARILVIDDDEDAFPVTQLQEEGYNIIYWSSVKNLRDLEQGAFDLIVLDIHGIDPRNPSNGGLKVLEHIKRYNPAQIVIACSGKKYDIKQTEFFKLADDVLGKHSSFTECKQKLDDLLETRFSAEYYWKALKTELQSKGVPEKSIAKLEKAITCSLKAKKPIEESDIMDILKTTKEVVGIAGTIISIIIKLSAS